MSTQHTPCSYLNIKEIYESIVDGYSFNRARSQNYIGNQAFDWYLSNNTNFKKRIISEFVIDNKTIVLYSSGSEFRIIVFKKLKLVEDNIQRYYFDYQYLTDYVDKIMKKSDFKKLKNFGKYFNCQLPLYNYKLFTATTNKNSKDVSYVKFITGYNSIKIEEGKTVIGICPYTNLRIKSKDDYITIKNHTGKQIKVHKSASERLLKVKGKTIKSVSDNYSLPFGYHDSNSKSIGKKVSDVNGYKFGVEIEAQLSNSKYEQITQYLGGAINFHKHYNFTVEKDSSLMSNSVEFISDAFDFNTQYDKRSILKKLNALYNEYLDDKIMKPTNGYGGHIHFSKTGMDIDKTFQSFCRYLPLLKTMYYNRANNSYSSINGYYNDKFLETRTAIYKCLNDVEVRIFPTPTSPKQILFRAELLKAFYENECTSLSSLIDNIFKSELINLLKIHYGTGDKFLKLVLNTIKYGKQIYSIDKFEYTFPKWFVSRFKNNQLVKDYQKSIFKDTNLSLIYNPVMINVTIPKHYKSEPVIDEQGNYVFFIDNNLISDDKKTQKVKIPRGHNVIMSYQMSTDNITFTKSPDVIQNQLATQC